MYKESCLSYRILSKYLSFAIITIEGEISTLFSNFSPSKKKKRVQTKV